MKINIGSMVFGVIIGWVGSVVVATISVGKKLVNENKELKEKISKGEEA